MEYTTIPHIDLKVSRIGLGTWAIGGSLWGGSNEQDSIKTIHKALDMGINIIDTAPAYGNGESEKVVGKAIKKVNRDKVVIATKGGLSIITKDVFRDSRKQSIINEVEASLTRLQTDYIDLYQIHWPDPKTPIAETAETLKGILQQGKVKAIGVSNYTVEEIEEFRKYCPLSSLQPPYNLFEEEAEHTLFPYCFKNQIALITYSALCRGLLSGKMTKDTKFKSDDLRGGMDPKYKEPRFSQYLSAVDKLEQWSQKKYHRPVLALAVRWVLDKGSNVALWGSRKPEQLDSINQVFGWKLNKNDFAEIQQILKDEIKDPIGPEFMSPPERK
jgi:aryl-alcohol dehydrogenase-like predicted oxidoreductase